MDSTLTEQKVTPIKAQTKTTVSEQTSSGRLRTSKLYDMTIMDEKSYTTNSKCENNRETMSSVYSSPAASPKKDGNMVENTSSEKSRNSQAKVTNLGSPKKIQVKERPSGSPKKIKQVNRGAKRQPQKSQYFDVSSSVVTYSTLNLSEAEHLLTTKQRELSEARYRQYKTLIHSLQCDLELTQAPSPSVPSSILTTPEKKASIYSNGNTMSKAKEPSSESDASISDAQVTMAPSPLDSPHVSDVSSASDNLSFVDKTHAQTAIKAFEKSQPSSPRYSPSSGTVKEHSDLQNVSHLQQSLPEDGATLEKGKILNLSSQKCTTVETVELGHTVLPHREITDRKLDVEKNVDSWEEESEDIIRVFVHSESCGTSRLLES